MLSSDECCRGLQDGHWKGWVYRIALLIIQSSVQSIPLDLEVATTFEESVRKMHILADQQNVHRAQVKLVEEWKSRKAFFGWVHTGIELSGQGVSFSSCHM